ncbi:mucin-2 [Drosophila sechellia]|nr:mucin-2 [Drosophila sechellia]
MDTVYGTKKYFQSLSGVSDIYRAQTCRQMSADYTYQNTVGRRSQLGAYYHMNKQPSYTNEHSLNSQYGYNTWGIWRDGRNIAPSTFSAKTHTQYPKNRSFSIILTTAAFIVLLAVISIAGLAFYFSSIKTNLEDPVMGFEGSFRIAKGDLFSTGLKYNHTTTYKQKIDFYKRFVERSMMDNGLQPLRTDVWGFGDGPLIKVSFRVFLDVRKLPQNILSVEEYIKESLFLETSAAKSLYRSLRLDTESVEIKRIMDEQVVRSAAILKEAQTVPTSQTQLEKRLMKKGSTPATPPVHPKPNPNTTPKPKNPLLRNHSADEEPDIDVENAPVIQGSFEGSFEITKTDADIARKKTPPTRAYQAASSTLPPKAIAVTPFSLRVKPKKPSIEKLTTVLPQQVPTGGPNSSTRATTKATKATTTTKRTTTSTTRKTTTTTTPKPTTTTTTTEATTTTTTSTTTTTPPPPPSTTRATTTSTTTFTYPSVSTPHPNQGGSLPKLDANLFTTFPILDTQPWRPMHREVPELLPGPPPAFPTKTLPGGTTPTVNHIPQRRIDEFELPFIADNPTPPTAAVAPVTVDPYSLGFLNPGLRVQEPKPNLGPQPQDQDMLFYHNFGSPIFMPGTENIERLGGALVEPHPLPVPLIDDVIIPPFKPIDATMGTGDKIPFNLDASNERFEHLGGGVIAKKPQEKLEKKEQPSKKEQLEPHVKEANQTAPEKKKIQANRDQKPDQPEITTKVEKKQEKVEVTTIPTNVPVKSSPKPTKSPSLPSLKPTDNSVLADTIGEFFMELLNLPKEENATATKKPTEDAIESRIEPEEEESLDTLKTPSVSHSKPNFMNLKEIILQRNTPSSILSNETLEESTTTTMPTTTTSTTTEEPRTTKRNRIRTTSERPTMMDDSNLFPSHSKWEFVNSSSAQGFGHNSNMRKVFNQTLQAWVSEDIDKSENLTLNDIKTRINNASNIQDISLIFDTLASKLGITPSVPNKFPPFSQNKLKQAPKEDVTRRPIPSSTTMEIPLLIPESLLPVEREPFIKPMSSFIDDGSSEVLGAAIPVIGEAEVEVVDPLNYEEMLKISQFAASSTEPSVHKLVTLLPVRSNSGIRTYRPPAADEETQRSASAPAPLAAPAPAPSPGKISIRRKSNLHQSRRFGQPPAEAVVKGGIQVTVKK